MKKTISLLANVLLLTSTVTSFAANVEEQALITKITGQYEYLRTNLHLYLNGQVDAIAADFLKHLEKCVLTKSEDAKTLTVSGDSCGFDYRLHRELTDKGLDDHGTPIQEEQIESDLVVTNHSLVDQLGISSWSLATTARSESLAFTPAEVNVHTTNIRLLTSAAQEVDVKVSGRTYVNTETSEHTVYRTLQLSIDNKFNTAATIKVVLQPHDAPKSVIADWDTKTTTLEQLVNTFSRSILSYPFMVK